MSQHMQYAAVATHEALNDARWRPKTLQQQENTGVIFGSGIGSLEVQHQTSLALERDGDKKVSPNFVSKLLINSAAGHISMKFGLKRRSRASSDACATSAHSIGDAAELIATNKADVMVAGGSESCIHPLAFVGFERLRALTTSFKHSPRQASRPFDAARDGFVIGEGAAALVLESLSHAVARKANIYAEVAGYGDSADAYHMTAPPEDGHGALISMQRALKYAGVSPSQVDYINAHATSTPLGDRAENHAIKKLMLGEDGKKQAKDINVSSTKGATGHLLGAAGALEAVFSILAVRDGLLPPTLNLMSVEGPDFNCNYVPLVAQRRKVDVALSNSFGFGGTNASLCIRSFDEK
ncbi:Mitochondrial beta-keto-acyl synthase [Puttea exsequens]|nr:Mitochondrial beta-keto-acyl synthase [Puttea exsequens]